MARGAQLIVCGADAAYEALSNEKQRSIYDQYGEEGLKVGAQCIVSGL